MDCYETTAKYNLAETCCESISLDALQSLSETPTASPLANSLSKPMLYGPIRGSSELRKNIARLYSTNDLAALPIENVLVTPGAILANFLFLYTMVGPGDHVVCMYPTYQQLYSVPESLGADVSLW